MIIYDDIINDNVFLNLLDIFFYSKLFQCHEIICHESTICYK